DSSLCGRDRLSHTSSNMARRRRMAANDSAENAAAVFDLSITRAPKSAEDLTTNGIVPIVKAVADRAGTRGPRSTAQHLVLGPEKDFRIFRVWKRDIPRIAPEVA